MRLFRFAPLLALAACQTDRVVSPEAPAPPAAPAMSVIFPKTPPVLSCKAQAPIDYFVSRLAQSGDGTRLHPFATITGALDAGVRVSACHLRLHLLGGTYRESFALPVRRLEVLAERGVNTIAGGIVNDGQWLTLRGVSIDAVGGIGIQQRGGRLQLVGLSISHARAIPKELDSGLGLWLTGGGKATLDLVVFDGNANQAIRLQDSGTEAWLTGTLVRNTGIFPAWVTRFGFDATDAAFAPVGAVQVSRGAKAIVKFSAITESVLAGLVVEDFAQVLLVRSTVSNTTVGAEHGFFNGALNISLLRHAVVEAHFLVTAGSDVADLMVQDTSYFTLYHTSVGDAPIGLVKFTSPTTPPFPPFACFQLDGTRFEASLGIPLQADVPELPPPLDAPPPDLSTCRRVSDDPRPF